ncbi:MAG TPA: BatA and WFA domain-containing protein [Melioribacteraceae bacterium]|nr:BatA and WFA domain-containing protein [Melioribacteraceae bacterium]
MVFLNPSILFGLIAAGIPILIHLLNLKRLKKIEFSTLEFLKELQKNKIKKVKIKQWILLLLRTLLIIFLVLSFSRPSVKTELLGKNNSTAKTTAVIIIDNTFSMSVVTDKGSYLNQAKSAAKKIINNLKEGDEAVIIPISSINGNFSLITDLRKVKGDIDRIQISEVSYKLHNAMVKASKIMENSDNFNKEIYILSDFQQKSLYEHEKELSDFRQVLNEQVRIYSLIYGGKKLSNLSVNFIEPSNQIFVSGKNIGFNVSVSNTGNFSVNNSVISLFINGERVAMQNISLSEGENKILYFETLLKNKGLTEIVVECEDDEILYDNRKYYTINIPEEIKLLLLTDDNQDGYFVNTALIKDDSLNYINLTEKNSSFADAINYNNFNAVILIGGKNIKNYEPIKNFINNKGGIIVFPSSTGNLTEFNNLLANINLPKVSGNVGGLGNKTGYGFGNINYEHPLFSELFEKDKKFSINSPDIYNYYKLNTGMYGRNIIEMEDKSPFLAEYNLDNSKILVFNCAPRLNWTNFVIKSLFAPIINRGIYYLTAITDNQESFYTGDKMYLNIGKSFSGTIDLQKGKGGIEKILTDSANSSGILQYNNTDEGGVYKFYNNGKLLSFKSVNVNPVESNFKFYKISDFEDYLKRINFKGRQFNINTEEDFAEKIYQSRFGTELWRLFLILAFITAILEMIIARSTKKIW